MCTESDNIWVIKFQEEMTSHDIKKCFFEKVNLGAEEFEDTKGVIRICQSNKNRQRNGQKKKNKGQTTEVVNEKKK